MTSKRPHTKSRTGCQQCKRRKIKCDGTPPCCRNCATKGLECEYQTLQGAVDALQLLTPESYSHQTSRATARSAQSSRSGSSLTASSKAGGDVPPTAPSLNSADLGLFYNYLLYTYKTVGPASMDHTSWQVETPRLALSHPFLMHAILGLSAAHQISQSLGSDSDSVRLAREHYAAALRTFRESFESSTSPDEHAVFRAFTTIITILFINWECREASDRSTIDGFSGLLGLMQSSSAINLRTGGSRSAQSDVFPSVHLGSLQSIPPDLRHSLQGLQDELPQWACEPSEAASLGRAFTALISHHSLVSSKPSDGSGFLIWPLSLDNEYITLLDRRSPPALCMLAHWCVPLCNSPIKWYAGDWPHRLLLAINSQLTGTVWHQHIQWALSETTIFDRPNPGGPFPVQTNS